MCSTSMRSKSNIPVYKIVQTSPGSHLRHGLSPVILRTGDPSIDYWAPPICVSGHPASWLSQSGPLLKALRELYTHICGLRHIRSIPLGSFSCIKHMSCSFCIIYMHDSKWYPRTLCAQKIPCAANINTTLIIFLTGKHNIPIELCQQTTVAPAAL